MASGVSSADVRSIFSLPPAGTSSPAPSTFSSARAQPPSGSAGANAVASGSATPTTGAGPSAAGGGGRKGKPEGISRELYALIGAGAPALALAAQTARPKFKAKPVLSGATSGGRAEHWEWRKFENKARKDGLTLWHWVKASSDANSEYPFAKYNVSANVYTYSEDEYNRLLEDKDWTKDETDYLFDLVRVYDVRFYVVADRYDYPGGEPRSLEDIKDRYYSVCRRLIRNRPWAGDEASKTQILASLTFDKEREVTRKKYIASLENRTPEQIAEEEALYLEIKRLEQSERRFARERDDLLRTFAGIESGLPSAAADDDALTVIFGDGKKRKKGTDGMLESPLSATASVVPMTPTRRVQSAKSAAQDAQHCIYRTDSALASGASTKAAHQQAYLRAWRLPAPKAAVAPKVIQALAEVGVSASRLVMPTRENVTLLESCIHAATALVETKKVVDKVDLEIRTLRARLNLPGSESEAEKDGVKVKEERGEGGKGKGEVDRDKERAEGDKEDEGDAEGEAEADGEADVDAEGEQEEEEGEVERAQSVAASVRSAGRKHNIRSQSTSSADTSATTGTRSSRKRQKMS